jgi:hypothetical protein
MDNVWKLKLGQEVFGVLTRKEIDQPWTFCVFEPTPAFEQYRALFEEELQLLNRDDIEHWQQAYHKITSLGFTLEPVGTEDAITEFILHIDGGAAWFRY